MKHKQKFFLDLEDAETLKDVFLICEKYYHIEKAVLTTVSKSIVKSGIKTAINLIDPQEKNL